MSKAILFSLSTEMHVCHRLSFVEGRQVKKENKTSLNAHKVNSRKKKKKNRNCEALRQNKEQGPCGPSLTPAAEHC